MEKKISSQPLGCVKVATTDYKSWKKGQRLLV